MGKVIFIVLIAAILWEWEKSKTSASSAASLNSQMPQLPRIIGGLPGGRFLRDAPADTTTTSNFDKFVMTGGWEPSF